MKGPVLRQAKLSTLGLTVAALAAGLGVFTTARSGPPGDGSLPGLDIEKTELKVALDKVAEENKQLREALVEKQTTLAETQKTLAEMRKNLAMTSGESEIFRRQSAETRKLIDALGLDTGDPDKLRERLLAAVNDLRITAEEKKKLSEAVIRLSEAASMYAKSVTGASPEARVALEAEIRNANMALGLNSPNAVEASAIPASLSDGAVISVKDDLALVVINLGAKQGVKVGMPFQVTRGQKIIGSVRVVDVREKIAGAFLQDLSSEKDRVQVGDHLRVDAHLQ